MVLLYFLVNNISLLNFGRGEISIIGIFIVLSLVCRGIIQSCRNFIKVILEIG